MTKKRKVLNWKAPADEAKMIRDIAVRGVNLAKELGYTRDLLTMVTDITLCHLNGNPLDLVGLLEAENGDFGHDVFGIQRHIDRETGELLDCFCPRLSRREQEVEPPTVADFSQLFEAIAKTTAARNLKGG